MRSNVCKIENGTKDLAAILCESEKVAVYNELTHKQTLQLRLLCEEIDGMLPNIIGNFSGGFWIDFEDGVCKVNVSLRFEDFTTKKKEELVAFSKNKKNASANGVVGMIRSALEDVFFDRNSADGGDMMHENVFWERGSYSGGNMMLESNYFVTEYYNGMDQFYTADYTSLWSLEHYRSTVKNEEKTEKWDELEKSVIASIADDIIVGVKGKRADIVIVKKFA